MPSQSYQEKLALAQEGDIHAFQSLFAPFQDRLKSYLYRLTTSRADAEDFAHDTFIRAFDKLSSFQGRSSLQTWVFQIATNLAYQQLQRRKRWTEEVAEDSKDLVMDSPALISHLETVAAHSPAGGYEIREHIDTCFTCMSKTLMIDQQVALLLKEVYDFSVREIMLILGKSEGQVKYLLQNSRATLSDIFDRKCALVNQQGTCHQCSELNGWLNPKQDQQAAKLKIKMVRAAQSQDSQALFQLRLALVKGIDPLKSNGNELQEALMNCNRMAAGEMDVP